VISLSQPLQIVPTVYETTLEVQRVYLHEVKNAMNGNFLSQVFTSVGAGILTISLPLANFAIPLWPLGIFLILLGVGIYWRSVRGAYKSWERRRVLAGQYTISSGGSGSEGQQGQP
jgi:hypothetical protein